MKEFYQFHSTASFSKVCLSFFFLNSLLPLLSLLSFSFKLFLPCLKWTKIYFHWSSRIHHPSGKLLILLFNTYCHFTLDHNCIACYNLLCFYPLTSCNFDYCTDDGALESLNQLSASPFHTYIFICAFIKLTLYFLIDDNARLFQKIEVHSKRKFFSERFNFFLVWGKKNCLVLDI